MHTTLILDNIRSLYNVGAIARCAAAFGAERIICCGLTPYPEIQDDGRLPHVRLRAGSRIAKVALGAERLILWQTAESAQQAIAAVRDEGFRVAALEQAAQATPLHAWSPPQQTALVLGPERTGLAGGVLDLCDEVVEIEHAGGKESLNVSAACAIALYRRFTVAA